MKAIVLIAAAAVVGIVLAVGLTSGTSTPSKSAGEPLWKQGMFPALDQTWKLAIRPAPEVKLVQAGWRTGFAPKGPDERVTPSNFAVQPSVPVKVIVTNFTRMAHTFTSPELGVSFYIPAGRSGAPSRTSFTFVPNKRGVFRWFCALPCGDYMGGNVYSIIGQV